MLPSELPSWFLAGFVLAYGLILGSFLNVVIHRLPLGQSIVRPRSRCPKCGQSVGALDNIPVLGWLWLRGKCRNCAAPISVRYPFVELLMGLLASIAFLRRGLTLEFGVEFAFAAAMVALVFIDYDHQILPDSITLPGLALGALLSLPRLSITPLESLKGAALGAGLLYFVSKTYYFLRKEEGLGFGDVKMMGMVGAFLGWKGVLLTLFLGSLSGSLVGVALMRLAGGDMKTKLPFGTFLGMGAVLTMFGGAPIIDWYASLF